MAKFRLSFDLPFVQKTRKRKNSRLVTRMNTRLHKRNDPAKERKIVTIGVMVSVAMVGVSVFVAVFFNAEAVAHRKFEQMAKEYYEDYYYDKFFETMTEEAKLAKMEVFEKTGLQPVLLRQLLLYQNGKNAGMKKYFEAEGYKCDRNTTSAKFYPVKPYGRTDYTVEYNYSCQTE
ncbi:hypothetical protein IJI17_03140 [Candidatus Saccharibacteria bacterium]|nr:hypothetical protein [Candidatus Saccharibacteria bacterium]